MLAMIARHEALHYGVRLFRLLGALTLATFALCAVMLQG